MLINVDGFGIYFQEEPITKKTSPIPISNLLSNKKTTVEDLLNFENILDEFNSRNTELLNYFTKDKIKILINYMIKEPENDDYEKGQKFSFICAEIFKLKIDNILEKFFIDDNTNNNNELLDELFSFLINNNTKNTKKLNSILCGYFTSTIDVLLNYNPILFLKYIYLKRKDILKAMINSYNTSIMEILGQILFFEKYDNNNNNKEYAQLRYDTLKDIFNNINIDMDNEDLTSIYFFINNFFQKDNIEKLKDIFKKVIDDESIIKNLIYNNLYNLDLISNSEIEYEKIYNRRNNFVIIINIIINLLKNIDFLRLEKPKFIISIDITNAKSSIKHTNISENIFNIIERLIELNFKKRNLQEKKILQAFNDSYILPLGEYKIKIIEFISKLISYFSIISKNFDEILIKTEFFKYVFEYIFDYEWNNLYQEEVLNLMKIIILNNSSQHKLLIDHLIIDLKLLDLIKQHLLENNKFKYSNSISNNISRGYISFLISLSYKINTAMEDLNLKLENNGSFEFRKNQIFIDNEEDDIYNFFSGISISVNHSKRKTNDNDYTIIMDDNYNYMRKFLNDDWKLFFNNNIYGLIKQYDNKKWPIYKEEKENIFKFFSENEDDNPENEDLLKEEKIFDDASTNKNMNESSDIKSNNSRIDSDLMKFDYNTDLSLAEKEITKNFHNFCLSEDKDLPQFLRKKTKSDNLNNNSSIEE